MVEDLCVEDTKVLDSCVQFLNDYKRLDLFDWIVKTEHNTQIVTWFVFVNLQTKKNESSTDLVVTSKQTTQQTCANVKSSRWTS